MVSALPKLTTAVAKSPGVTADARAALAVASEGAYGARNGSGVIWLMMLAIAACDWLR